MNRLLKVETGCQKVGQENDFTTTTAKESAQTATAAAKGDAQAIAANATVPAAPEAAPEEASGQIVATTADYFVHGFLVLGSGIPNATQGIVISKTVWVAKTTATFAAPNIAESVETVETVKTMRGQ